MLLSQVKNITEQISNILSESEVNKGIVTIFIKHTTASIMIFEDEPGLRKDTKSIWETLIPVNQKWQHNTLNTGEDNGHSHLRGQIQGQSLTVPFLEKKLTLAIQNEDYELAAKIRDQLNKLDE